MNREIELLEEIISLIVVLWSEILWIMDEFDRLSWWYNDIVLVGAVAIYLGGVFDD